MDKSTEFIFWMIIRVGMAAFCLFLVFNATNIPTFKPAYDYSLAVSNMVKAQATLMSLMVTLLIVMIAFCFDRKIASIIDDRKLQVLKVN